MFSTGEVNQKCELAAYHNKTVRYVGAGYWARVPCIKKKQDCLKSHTDSVAFISHDFEAFCEVSNDPFDNHRVVISRWIGRAS